MNRLHVTDEWMNYFGVGKFDWSNRSEFEIRLDKSIEDDRLYYEEIISFIDLFITTSDWLQLNSILLKYSDHISKSSLRNFDFNIGNSFDNWKKNVLDIFGHTSPPRDTGDLLFGTNLNYRYLVTNENNKNNIYGYSSFHNGLLIIDSAEPMYTYYKIILTLNKHFFLDIPLTKDGPALPTSMIEHNRSLLKKSILKLEEHGFKLEHYTKGILDVELLLKEK